MTDSGVQYDETNLEQGTRLKHLEFVQAAAVQAVMCLSSLYNFAKENAGPLRSGVQAVEGTVKAVVGPVYEKIHDVPLELLKLVDRKVDDFVGEVERHVPSLLKKASTEAYAAAQRAPKVARSVAGEVQRFGVVATTVRLARVTKEKYGPVVRDAFGLYEPVVERYAVVAWRSLNKLPVFPQVAQIVVPTAAYWAEKYNKAVGFAAERGYVLAEFLPLAPTERIAKVFVVECGARSGNATDRPLRTVPTSQ